MVPWLLLLVLLVLLALLLPWLLLLLVLLVLWANQCVNVPQAFHNFVDVYAPMTVCKHGVDKQVAVLL
jgi:hypothetical protein